MKQTTLLAITFCFFTWMANGQNNTQWKTYLEGYQIRDIADAGDYLWLITETRVIKFDKITGNLKQYYYGDFHIQPDDWITNIECDNDGLPWVGTFAGAFKMTDDNNWVLLHPRGAFAITKSKDGVVWIAYQHELIRYEADSIKVIDEDRYGGGYFSSLATDNNGDLWGSRTGLIFRDLSQFDGNNWNSFTQPVTVLYTFPPFGFISVMNLTIDKNDTKWMSGFIPPNEHQLISYTDSIWKFYDLPATTIIYSVAIENDNVWCGTRDGLMRFTNSHWTVFNTENSELPSGTIYQITIDSDGIKWIGTENGLVAFNENGLTTSTDIYSKKIKEIELFPNPANNFITLKMPGETQKSTVDILNMQGKLIKSFSWSNDQNRLDVSQFTAGVYLVRIQSEENYAMKKFVKN